MQGSVVAAIPGRSGVRPAGGARIQLLGTALSTVADRETGRFELNDIVVSTGKLFFAWDSDGDGQDDRQRVLDAAAIGLGRGKNVALGEVALSRNAVVVGRVLRLDNPLATGHSGTAVFVAGAPFATVTGDSGDFVLENLPEGPLQLTLYRPGYAPESRDLVLRGGEEARLATSSLRPAGTGAPMTVTVTGTLRLDDRPVANARLRFVSPRTSFTTTSDAEGAFSVQAQTADLYQVGIEADGVRSLRLYNLLLVEGTNPLGVIQLTAGTSTSLVVDAGISFGGDAGSGSDAGSGGDAGSADDAGSSNDGGALPDGGVPVVAVIDPPREVAPGGTSSLGSGNSLGVRPLTSRWRNAGDAGGLSFTTTDTVSPSVQFTAPATAGLYPVALEVTDARGVRSAEVQAVVRVGARPTVSATSVSGQSVASGIDVDLQAMGVSADGSLIAEYRWRQLTGPAVFVPSSSGDTLRFRSPIVPAPTPMSFEVTAVTSVGFESLPAGVSLIVQPLGAPMVTITATPPNFVFTGDAGVIRLSASLSGGPPDASWDFTWTPVVTPCVSSGALRCKTAPVLSNPDAAVTEFVVTEAYGTFTTPFSVLARERSSGATATNSVVVRISDQRPPQCRDGLSPLAWRVECDEPVQQSGFTFDAGVDTPRFQLSADGGLFALLFYRPLAASPTTYAGSLQDLGGNLWERSFSLTPTLGVWLQDITSAQTSTTPPRATWVTPSPGPAPFLVGRQTSASDRSIWTLVPGMPPVEARPFTIPFAGTPPGPATSAVTVGERAYVIVSRTNPPSLAEFTRGAWAELDPRIMPPLTGLGVTGAQVSILTADGGTLARQVFTSFDDGGGVLGPSEVLGNDFGGEHAELLTDPNGRVFAFYANTQQPRQVSQLEYSMLSTWDPLVLPLVIYDGPYLSLKGAICGPNGFRSGVLVQRDSDSHLVFRHDSQNGNFLGPLDNFGDGFDVARFGPLALVSFVSNGNVRLSAVVPDPLDADPTTALVPLASWPAPNAVNTRVVVSGTTVYVSWDHGSGTSYRMSGRALR